MPQYPHRCPKCSNEFDILKSVCDLDRTEVCPDCGETAERLIALSNLEKSALVQPYYEPALGCVVKGKGHKAQILKDRGLEEVGTTSPDTMYKNLEGEREKQRAKEWDNL